MREKSAGRCGMQEKTARLIDVNSLGRYAVNIDGHKYIPWVALAEVPTACSGPAKLNRSRWEGCEDCGGEERCGICKFRGDYAECESDFLYPCSHFVPFGFCKTCGRPLTEAAWAELERKIGGTDGTSD